MNHLSLATITVAFLTVARLALSQGSLTPPGSPRRRRDCDQCQRRHAESKRLLHLFERGVGLRQRDLDRRQSNNIAIQNGSILSSVVHSGGSYGGGGFVSGITWADNPPQIARVSNVTVRGVQNHGISLGVAGTTIQSCAVWTAGGTGLNALQAAYAGQIASHCYGLGFGTSVQAQLAVACGGLGSVAAPYKYLMP